MTVPTERLIGLNSVSRETLRKLEVYEALIRKWQKAINLVSENSLDAMWHRHFADSWQLIGHVPKSTETWLDMGTGGGFPGLVCALIASETNPEIKFTFLESDTRKCVFLRDVLRQTETQGLVINKRIEEATPQTADIISARALAPLDRLLGLAFRHLALNGTCLFLKGANYKAELAALPPEWHMSTKVIPSTTSTSSVILKLQEISHAAER